MDSIHLNRSFYDSNEQKGSYSYYDRLPYRSSETGPASEKANVKSDIRDSKGSEESSGRRQFPSNIICHNCGEAGHIRPNCPKLDRKPRKIGYVSTGSLTDGSQPVIGLVNGIKTPINLDSGAEFSVISRELAKNADMMGRSVVLNWIIPGHFIEAPVCKVNIAVLGQELECEAAIVLFDNCEFVLGVNVGKVALAELIHASAHRPHQVAVTRLQVQQEKELDEHCAVLDEASGAVPHLDESTDWMEAVEVATDMPAPAIPEDSEEAQSSSEEEHTMPSTSDKELTMSTAAGEDADVPITSLDEEQRKQLVECTRTDPTLKVLREHADKGILGHCWKDGLLLHEAELSNFGTVHRIVVPSQFRRMVLELAHERAGHLSITKMRAPCTHGWAYIEMCVPMPLRANTVRGTSMPLQPRHPTSPCQLSRSPSRS